MGPRGGGGLFSERRTRRLVDGCSSSESRKKEYDTGEYLLRAGGGTQYKLYTRRGYTYGGRGKASGGEARWEGVKKERRKDRSIATNGTRVEGKNRNHLIRG